MPRAHEPSAQEPAARVYTFGAQIPRPCLRARLHVHTLADADIETCSSHFFSYAVRGSGMSLDDVEAAPASSISLQAEKVRAEIHGREYTGERETGEWSTCARHPLRVCQRGRAGTQVCKNCCVCVCVCVCVCKKCSLCVSVCARARLCMLERCSARHSPGISRLFPGCGHLCAALFLFPATAIAA